MILRVGGSTVLLFLTLLTVDFFYNQKMIAEEIHAGIRNQARFYAEKFEGRFLRAQQIPKTVSIQLTANPIEDEEILKRQLKRLVENNPDIYGTCVAYEPYGFDGRREFVAPYYYRKNGTPTFVQLGSPAYNYIQQDWYARPKKANQALWTDPYFDTGGGETMMITYASPFYHQQHFKGVVTVDLCLDELANEVNRMRVGKTGYGFLLNGRGTILSFPDKNRIMNSTLAEVDPSLDAEIAEARTSLIEHRDPVYGEPSWIVFHEVPSADLIIGIVFLKEEVFQRVYSLEKASIWLGLVGILLLILLIFYFSNAIARPIVKLVQGTKRVALGELEFRIDGISTKDEVGVLANAFNTMVLDLKEYVERLKHTTAENERIRSELKIAREIQLSILPRTFPPFPQDHRFLLFADTIPAREMGGDFYDFFLLDDNRLGMVIADVSGKGVPAALFMAVSRTLIKATALRDGSPEACFEKVNDLLSINNESAMFVTAFYGVLNLSTGEMKYANGGHNPPYVIRQGNVARLPKSGNLPLGAWQGSRYNGSTIAFEPGDGIFLYTDGVPETMDREHHFFEETRLKKVLEQSDWRSAQKLLGDVIQAVDNFRDENPYSDDITAMALLYSGPEEFKGAVVDTRVKIEISADAPQISNIHKIIEKLGEQYQWSSRLVNQLQVATDEIVTNIIAYGVEGAEPHMICVQFSLGDPNCVQIEITDDGKPFDPMNVPAADTKSSVDERKVGGLGIHIVKTLMDSLEYSRFEGKNILILTKQLKPGDRMVDTTPAD